MTALRMRTPLQSDSRTEPKSWLAGLRDTLFGLQCRATVLLVMVMLLATTVLCGFSIEKTWLLTSRLAHKQAVRHAAMVAKLASEPMRRGHCESLEQLAAELTGGDLLLFVQFTDVAGDVVASAESHAGGLPTDRSFGAEEHAKIGVSIHHVLPQGGGNYLDVRYPIHRREQVSADAEPDADELLGYVRLGVGRGHTMSAFKATADLFIGIAAIIVALSVPVAFLVVRRIVIPINAMSQTARRFSAGDFGARTEVNRSDEIGLLADNLNAMADEVERKHREIVAFNAKLEERVEERTAQLRELAVREPLTGLYNRRHFSEVLTRRFSEARRYGNDLSLVMIDVDNFKGVNDALGHQAGDELLVQTALVISSQLRAADVAARFGGDEFIILLPQSNGDQARRVVDRIVDRFCGEARKKFDQVRVTLSVGVASLQETGMETDEEFVRAADQAMYDAKASGKDRVVMAAVPVQ